MKKKSLSRRRFIATSAGASASLIAAPFVRAAHAAGKLSVGFWDHWVPGANDTSKALVEEWAAKEKVDVQIDYITSQGEKQRLTIAAESQARSGHDIMQMPSWWPHAYANNLESVDDIVAEIVDANEKVTVKTDAVRQALDFYKRCAQFFPPDAPSWDDASNNKWLVSGKGALIMNPPSAWAVAKRDAPKVAEQLWTHGMPAGPSGRYAPFLPYFWGIWKFSKNKSAAKSLLLHLSQPSAVEKMVVASGGYDLPAFEKLTTLKVWQEEGPPKGTLYHYPNPHNHQVLSVAAQPAPPKIAVQIYTQAIPTKMVVRFMQGEALEKTLAWAEGEIEGFMRS